jgi:hypothetical protein
LRAIRKDRRKEASVSQRLGTGRYTSIGEINESMPTARVQDSDWSPENSGKNKQFGNLQIALQGKGVSAKSLPDCLKHIQGNVGELLGQNQSGTFGSYSAVFTIITWTYEDEGPDWRGFENYEPEPKFFMGASSKVCPQTEEPFAFVVCLDGSIRIGEKHKNICAGAPALWAGEVFFNGNGRVCCWGDRSGTYNRNQDVKAEVIKYYMPFPSNSFQKFSSSSTKLQRPKKVLVGSDDEIDLSTL